MNYVLYPKNSPKAFKCGFGSQKSHKIHQTALISVLDFVKVDVTQKLSPPTTYIFQYFLMLSSGIGQKVHFPKDIFPLF